LGEGSALPVGVPVPWPTATPPAGWLKCDGPIYAVSLSVDGTTGEKWIQGAICFHGRMVQVFLITQVILTLGLVIQSITMTKSLTTNLDSPVFHLQVLREAMGLIM